MPSPSEPAATAEPAPRQEKTRTLDAVAYGLAAAWIFLPAIQYYATYQRTSLQLEGKASIPDLAVLDLTPYYLALLAMTVVFVLMERRR